jgi:3-hydroxyisobutyrate dehydrogenase
VNYQLEKIGFIGLGVMGAWMCKNLLKAGYTVNVWNRTPSKMKEQISEGAVPCNSPKEVAEKSDIIIIMVGDGPDVEEVVLSPSGVIEGVVSGSVVIDMSSTLPAAERHVAAILEKKGIEMLDAPVSGGEVGAREAALSIMVGGHKETYEKCLPVLSVLGRKITYMGESGSGQATKLCNQVICALHIQAVCESLILGAKLGLDLERLLAVVTAGYGNSRILEDLGPKMIKKDFKPGFRMRHQLKDLKNALATATTANLPMPCTSLTYQLFESVAAMGLQESGTQVSIQVMEKLAQYKLEEKHNS